MELKIFLVCFGWSPSERESSVIVAETKEKALELARKEYNNDDDGLDDYIFHLKKIGEELNSDGDNVDYAIREINMNKEEIIYTGYSCC